MKPRLYLETTIPSYLAARPSRDPITFGHQEATRLWWNEHRHRYDFYVSEFVAMEIARGDAAAAAARTAFLDEIPRLSATPQVLQLARALIAEGLIPQKAGEDAAHIAVATVHGMDFLLTWNCRHIHNVTTLRRIEQLCAKLGYACPVICSPDELLAT